MSRGSWVRVPASLICLSWLVACTGPPDAIVGLSEPAPVGLTSHEIFVMTTRAAVTEPTIMYGTARAQGINLGRVTVTVPPGHQPGRLERARNVPPDPRKSFALVDPRTYDSTQSFVADVNRALRSRAPRDRSILAFVHGFNTSYASAVLRMGQFVEDTGFRGVPVLFTWASAGELLKYVYDLNSALSARNDLVASSDILLRTDLRKLDIVAHSMGNLLTVEAMYQAQLQRRFNKSGKLDTIILASADIDVDVFREQMQAFDPDDRTFYVLISEDDKALATSRLLAGGVNRVGDEDAEALAALGVTVIDLSAVSDQSSVHHTKFAESPEVVQLIGASISAGGTLETSADAPGIVDDLTAGVWRLTGSIGAP